MHYIDILCDQLMQVIHETSYFAEEIDWCNLLQLLINNTNNF